MRFAVISLLSAAVAFAHEGESLAPHDLWTAWEFAPGIVIPLIAAALLYWRGARIERGIRRWEIACFWSGWLTLVIALVSPVHPLGEALFSAHMVQHELLMVLAAPLLILGRPLVPFLWALPPGLRQDAARWSKSRTVQRTWSALTGAWAAWAIHAVVLWGWHAPALFEATLTSDAVHSAQHISFLASALLFWWALFHDRMHGRGYGAGVLYLFTTAVHTSVLGAFLTFSNQLWYPAYAPRTAPWGLTPMEDQQLGGLIMWVPAGITYIVAGLWMMALWIRESEIRASRREAALLLIGCCLAASNCGDAKAQRAAAITGGNPWSGKNKIQYYGCGSCHTIPGVTGAAGLVGPPLADVASRVYLGGVVPNTPTGMAQWIRNPQAIDPKTAMPNLHVTERDARDITAYLYSLK